MNWHDKLLLTHLIVTLSTLGVAKIYLFEITYSYKGFWYWYSAVTGGNVLLCLVHLLYWVWL